MMEFPINGASDWFGSIVTPARLGYTRDYLTSGICRLIKPHAMEKLMPFLAKIHTVML